MNTIPVSVAGGSVIAHSPAASGIYLGTPNLLLLEDRYLAAFDEFGPGSTENEVALTRVYESLDRGTTWGQIALVPGMYWATLFEHDGALYLLGCSKQYGSIVIARSGDSGRSWTGAGDGVLLEGHGYHGSSMPLAFHNGRIWRAFERRVPAAGWAENFQSLVISAPVESDLTRAENWTASEPLSPEKSWSGGQFTGWLEGNVLVSPEGDLVNILRVDTNFNRSLAAMVHVESCGSRCRFSPEDDLLEFPGGATKFAIRRDSRTGRFYALSNAIPKEFETNYPAGVRNTLVLLESDDLRHWSIQSVLIHHPDRNRHGFQYVDWQFSGDDIFFVSRTASDDADGGARNFHDSNYMTFHRVENFRGRTLQSPWLNYPERTGLELFFED